MDRSRTRLSVAVCVVLATVSGACAGDVSVPDSAATSPPTVVGPTATVGPDTTTSVPATTTSMVAEIVYRFPIDPASAASYSSGHHDYPATDIFASEGSRFVAPTSGSVDFVSTVDTWDPAVDEPSSRGGLSVAIVGDDGVRYYGSHLSSIAPGVQVGRRIDAGDLLGLTGRSGNAADTDPHLHFGVSRPTTPDDWAVRRGEVDTFPLLQAWEGGENLTPTLPGP